MNNTGYILIAAITTIIFATTGWIITVTTNRSLSRKQHTFNALLEMSLNKELENRLKKLGPHLRKGTLPVPIDPIAGDLIPLLDHYEFLAAAIRNGSINEKLLWDSDSSVVVRLVEVSQSFIEDTRRNSPRKTEEERNKMWEHIVWLYRRWTDARPCGWQRKVEWFRLHPIYPTGSNARFRPN